MGLTVTFGTVAQLPAELAVPYLQAALAEPYGELQLKAFETLERIDRPDAIIRSHASLAPEVRERVDKKRADYVRAARQLLKSDINRNRRAAYEFLTAFDEPNALRLVAQGVSDPSPAVRDGVFNALEKFALQYHYHLLRWQERRNEQSWTYLEKNRGAMMEAAEILLRAYTSHRRDVFISIAVESGGEAYRLISGVILGRRDPQLQDAFLRVMQQTNSPAAIDVLLRLLHERHERLCDIARTIFRYRRDSAFVSALARFLSGLQPGRYAELAAATTDLPWWEALLAAKDLDPDEIAEHIRFVSKTALIPATQMKYLKYFLESDIPAARAEALTALGEKEVENFLEICKASLKDSSPEVQFAAAARIIDLNPPDKVRLLTPFVQSEHEELRHLAMREVARASFDRYLRSFDKLDDRTREIAARAIAKIDSSMIDRLTEEVGSLDPARRLKALKILDYAELEGDVQPTIRELLNDRDTRVRATAIKLVEMSGNIEAMRQVLQMLTDADRRVRANAIEAFEEIGDTRFAQILLPFCQDPDNRVRANAAKALWNLGRREVVDVLFGMLNHPDENMRSSAVWALGEIRPEGVGGILRQHLAAEKSDAVCARIEQALEDMGAAGKE
ncbi:MAG: HEAT repeat domain-containing protein [Planctomycetota bacterium]|jgi:HEAT repeat protein